VIVPGYVFPLMMIVGAGLALFAAWAQFNLLRTASSTAANNHSFESLRTSPRWKRMRWMLWTGAFLLILGGLMQIPEMLR
jgi:hypothetical protein